MIDRGDLSKETEIHKIPFYQRKIIKESKKLKGLDSLLSIVQMPPGIPVGTLGIGGTINAALLAASIIALEDKDVSERLKNFRKKQSEIKGYKPLS